MLVDEGEAEFKKFEDKIKEFHKIRNNAFLEVIEILEKRNIELSIRMGEVKPAHNDFLFWSIDENECTIETIKKIIDGKD